MFVEADKERITQVISNLLNNAIKFTEEGIQINIYSLVQRLKITGRMRLITFTLLMEL